MSEDAAMGDWSAASKAIKDRAAELGMTQQDLAVKAKVSLSTAQEVWRGLPRKRSGRTLVALSTALGWPSGRLAAILAGKTPEEADQPETPDVQQEMRAIRDEMARLMTRVDALSDRLGSGS